MLKLSKPDEYRDYIQQVVADNTVLLAETNLAIIADVQECIQYCDAATQTCVACIAGEISSTVRLVDDAIGRAESKIIANVRDSLSQSYILAQDIVGPPPHMDDVLRIVSGVNPPTSDTPLPYVPPETYTPPSMPTGSDRGDVPPPTTDGRIRPIKPQCPPGSVAVFREDIWIWECIPGGPQPGPTPGPTCKVIPPVITPIPPGPDGDGTEPPCPAPENMPCPPGFAWTWMPTKQAWECTKGGVVQPPGGGDEADQLFMPDWCDRLGVDKWAEIFRADKDSDGRTLSERAGFGKSCDGSEAPDWVDRLAALVPLIPNRHIRGVFCGMFNILFGSREAKVNTSSQNGTMWVLWSTVRTGIGFFKSWFGLELGPVEIANQQAHNFVFPTGIPTPGEIDQLFAYGVISEQAHRNLQAAHNLCPSWSDLTREAKRSVLGVSDVVQQWRRGLISSVEMDGKIRRLGFIKPGDAQSIREVSAQRMTPDNWVKLFLRKEITREQLSQYLHGEGVTEPEVQRLLLQATKYIPTISDIIPLMVRDAFDNDIAGKYNYDHEFSKKYTKQAETWGEANGMTREQAQLFWRAHWRNPSPTQLFTALHRLRKDSLNPEAARLAVTYDDVKAFLEIDDVQPWWVERVMASSYLTMTRLELKQAYMAGSMDRKQVYSGLRDYGYDDYGANQILAFYDTQKARRRLNDQNIMTTRKVIKAYKGYAITYDDAKSMLRYNDIPEDDIVPTLDRAVMERNIEQTAKLIAMLRRRYNVGDLGPGEAQSELVKIGVPVSDAVTLADVWEAELQLRGKEISATVLCKWHGRGLIDVNTFYVRLVRVGYSPVDARRVIGACQADIAEKAQKEAERRSKEQASEKRRRDKEMTNGKP